MPLLKWYCGKWHVSIPKGHILQYIIDFMSYLTRFSMDLQRSRAMNGTSGFLEVTVFYLPITRVSVSVRTTASMWNRFLASFLSSPDSIEFYTNYQEVKDEEVL
jgi:hypothetical protein